MQKMLSQLDIGSIMELYHDIFWGTLFFNFSANFDRTFLYV